MKAIIEMGRLAAKQAGIVSRQQLSALGIKLRAVDHAVETGVLIPQHPGVYRLPSTLVSRDSHLWADVRWVGHGAVVSHLSAAWLWKLEGLGRKPPHVVDVSVRATRQRRDLPNVRVHRSRTLAPVKDFATLGGVPCTSLARTLIDLAGVLDPSALEHAFDSAVRRSAENRGALFEAMKRLGTRGRTGIGNLIEIASREELGCTQSWLENEVRQCLRKANIPLPMPQFAINDDLGRRIGIFDFAWPEREVVIVVDSWEHHGGRDMFEKDRVQWTKLQAIGWRPIPVTYQRLLKDEAGFLRELRMVLGISV